MKVKKTSKKKRKHKNIIYEMNERKYMPGSRVLLRNEKWKLRKCERQRETVENKSNCEDDRLQETREKYQK